MRSWWKAINRYCGVRRGSGCADAADLPRTSAKGAADKVATGTRVSLSVAAATGGADGLMVQWQSGEVRSGMAGFALWGQQAWEGSRWSFATSEQDSADVIARVRAITSAKPILRILPMIRVLHE